MDNAGNPVTIATADCLREVPAPAEESGIQSLQMMERRHILNTLEQVGWNRKRAAELLKISTTTLWRRLKEFGIDRESGVHAGNGGVTYGERA